MRVSNIWVLFALPGAFLYCNYNYKIKISNETKNINIKSMFVCAFHLLIWKTKYFNKKSYKYNKIYVKIKIKTKLNTLLHSNYW